MYVRRESPNPTSQTTNPALRVTGALTTAATPATRSPEACTEVRLSVVDLVLGYDGVPIVQIERLELCSSQVLSVVGKSGCGKTTLLSCLSGHLEPLSGSFALGGRERGAGLPSTYVSRTLQSFPLFHWLTVRENLQLAARIRGVSDTQDLDGVLERFAARQIADRYPTGLSGGERCRASLSQAVICEPQMLLLDEPFSGLDTLVKEAVAHELFSYARENGVSVIFVTHDLRDAVEYADRVLVLGGKPARALGETIGGDQALPIVNHLLRSDP